MSIDCMQWAYEQQDLAAGIRFTLVTLGDRADEQDSCFPGQQYLSRKTGHDERTIRRHVAELQRLGKIRVFQRRRPDGRRTSDRYLLLRPGGPNAHLIGAADCPDDASAERPAAAASPAPGLFEAGDRPAQPDNLSAGWRTSPDIGATSPDTMPAEPSEDSSEGSGAIAPDAGASVARGSAGPPTGPPDAPLASIRPVDGDWGRALFGPGLAWLAGVYGKQARHFRPLLGKALKACRGDHRRVFELLAKAQQGGCADPAGWLMACVGDQHERRRENSYEAARRAAFAAITDDPGARGQGP